MRKSTLATILGISTFCLVFMPFLFPDDMTYIKKGESSIYKPFMYSWLCFSSFLFCFFSFVGATAVWEQILKRLKDE